MTFAIDKWYMDAVGDDGRVVIVYRIEARFAGLVVRAGSVLERGSSGVTRARTRWGRVPEVDQSQAIAWECPALEFSGGWQRSERVERVRLEDTDRRITWSCLAPNSTVEITSRGERWIGRSPASIAVSAAIALVYAFAMGVDFPDSNRRFARLA